MKNHVFAGVTAEFIGAFALTFAGAAAIIHTGGENFVAIALAHGLVLAVMISALMHISGGQFNPAVSIALGVIGKQPWPRALSFVAAQLAGAVVAAFILSRVFASSEVEAVSLGATLGSLSTGEGASPMWVMSLEIIATFMLMMAVLGTAVDQRGVGKTSAVGGFGIGLTLSAMIFAIGPFTGASLNPSRSFGPALVGGHWDMHWVYWAGPIAGAILAAVVWSLLLGGKRAD